VSVATPHARLGTWLLARLYHGSHLRLLNIVRFQGATLIEPDLQIARIRRLWSARWRGGGRWGGAHPKL